jgi:hypothetical protein
MVAANQQSVEAHARLMQKVAAEQEDVLSTLLLCTDDAAVADRLWGQLVDLLVEGMFLDLRHGYLAGEISRLSYLQDLGALAGRCRDAGLLPLPADGITL